MILGADKQPEFNRAIWGFRRLSDHAKVAFRLWSEARRPRPAHVSPATVFNG
jgi:hypothetical protein